MVVTTKLRQEERGSKTYIYIDVSVDGTSWEKSVLIVAAETRHISHLDPEKNTLDDYANAVSW